MFADQLVIRQNLRARRPVTLSWAQFVVVICGLSMLATVWNIFMEPYDGLSEHLHRMAARSYEQDFGFEMGFVRGWPRPYHPETAWWGIVRVTPGGRLDRAGFRAGDVVFTRHGSGDSALHGALRAAAAGQIGCLDLVNLEDTRRGDHRGREVCLNGTSTSQK